MTNQNVINNLEKTIKNLSNKIRKEDSIDPSQITSLAKLVTALTALSGTVRDPMEYGDPNFVRQLEEEAKQRQLLPKVNKKLIKRKEKDNDE
jgi:hypothetical protein